MKIFLIAIASFISSASAEFNLRAAVNQLLSSEQVETYDARIIVGGLKDVITQMEATQVAKHAKAAYNDIFGIANTGQKLNYIETTAATNIPSDSFWWTGECRFCSKKGATSKPSQEEAAFINAQVEFALQEDALILGYFYEQEPRDTVGLHFNFEENLCQRLRKSGIPNFTDAKECTFSFLAKPGMTGQVPIENTYALSKGQTAQAELILAGLKNGITQADTYFLDEIVMDAHNEAFAKVGLSLGAFQTLADVAVGGYQGWLQQCQPCCFDDEPLCPDDTIQNSVTVIVANAAPFRLASGSADEIKKVDVEISNNAFETLLCIKLRNSGIPTFEDVHTCSFNFVYTEVGQATSALVIN